MKNIHILKLISGIELISNIELSDDNIDICNQIITLYNPLRFGLTKEGGNVALYQYLISDPSSNNIKFNGKCIESYIIESNIDDELVKEYKSHTSVIQLI